MLHPPNGDDTGTDPEQRKPFRHTADRVHVSPADAKRLLPECIYIPLSHELGIRHARLQKEVDKEVGCALEPGEIV